MNYAQNFYLNKNYNNEINVYLNKNIKLDYIEPSLREKNKSIIGKSSIINYQNNSQNINKTNKSGNNTNNFSSSLKEQILSPEDDDIPLNIGKNKPVIKPINYLDDDIIVNHFNYHQLKKKNLSRNNKKTLILDLDETLVHSSFKPIYYDNNYYKPDIFLNINFRGNNHSVYVLKRPFVHEFLKEMNKIYNIIIFTASVKEYANPLLDILDTEKIIKNRLFREDCCRGTTGKFIKDLKILNMDLKDLILVDNNPISYSYNICNGIPIKTWHNDKTDKELLKIIPVLQFLANANDVRDYIPKFVENDKIYFNKINLMMNEINNENEQNKYLKPRAKSQKKLFSNKVKINNSFNFGHNNKQKQIYEDKKIDLEINKNNYINNYNDLIPNKRKINNRRTIDNIFSSINNEYNYNQNNNIIDKNIKNIEHNDMNKNFIEHHMNGNDKIKYNNLIKEENIYQAKQSYSKDKMELIQDYCKNKCFKGNIFNNNNNLNNAYINHYKNKSYNYIDDNDNDLNDKNNEYIDIHNNENIKRNNYLFNYQEKTNKGYITPKVTNKFVSNYSIIPYTTKNKNINSNFNKYSNDSYIQRNINKNMDNIIINNKFQQNKDIFSENGNSSNNSNYNNYFNEVHKNYYKYKYNCLKKSEKNSEISNNQININNNYDNSSINFCYLKENNNNKIYNYSNSNSNLNSINLYNKEESKMNNIMEPKENDLIYDKIQNLQYQISKETNYYIKRRMKLNKEKILLKRKENESKNDYYSYFNNKKNRKEINNNNYFYNVE